MSAACEQCGYDLTGVPPRQHVITCPECSAVTGLGSSIRVQSLSARAVVLALLAPPALGFTLSLLCTLGLDRSLLSTLLLTLSGLGVSISFALGFSLGATGLAWRHRRLLVAVTSIAAILAAALPYSAWWLVQALEN